jgi:predicted ATPase/class 3 adenylate cyclase
LLRQQTPALDLVERRTLVHDPPVTRELPAGTVTFLFTDVEGSTRLLHALGADAYADALAAHRRLLRDAFHRHGGVEVDTQGDAFFVAFPTAPGALAAAREATEALSTGPIRVRIGLHTGTPLLTDEGYVGADVHRAARIAAAGHGGQILVSSATAALVGSAALRDLGEHRLKDLTAAERIYQADPEEHPPLTTLHQTNLPVPATPFLGRDAELAELSSLLTRDDIRLVTLTGPGGTGKTRLALAASGAAADAFSAGVWWVPLAALRDPALVLPSAAAALGASGDLAEHIGDKRLLLLFDNFEHLTDAAAGLAALLAQCPNLTLLVTSREPLHLAGEHEYSVDPLAPAEAVELFLTRAVAARRDFTANGEVAQICERLDHLPLAIELAAARVKVLSPKDLLERLELRLPLLAGGARDAPERQRTLRATIEWSHELLTDEEQRLFARLAVFRGGCTLDAAEAVADADLDTLQSLVDKSLVRVRAESGRFWMLETIREFAIERLEASSESDELRRRHAEYFLAKAEEAEPHVMRDDVGWLDRLEADADNLRAALDWLQASGDAGGLQRLAGALWRAWYLRSREAEGLRRIEAALASSPDRTAARLKLILGASVMLLGVADPQSALARAHEGRALASELGDGWSVAYATMMIGNALSDLPEGERDFHGALEHLAEAARLFEENGDRHYGLIAHHNQGWIRGELGDAEAEKRIHEEDLAVAREIGNQPIEADCLSQLGMFARDEGRLDEAVDLVREALRLDHGRGLVGHAVTHISRLASIYARSGKPVLSAQLQAASEALLESLGSALPWWGVRRHAETLELLRAQGLDGDRLDSALAHGRTLSFEEAVRLAMTGDEV